MSFRIASGRSALPAARPALFRSRFAGDGYWKLQERPSGWSAILHSKAARPAHFEEVRHLGSAASKDCGQLDAKDTSCPREASFSDRRGCRSNITVRAVDAEELSVPVWAAAYEHEGFASTAPSSD